MPATGYTRMAVGISAGHRGVAIPGSRRGFRRKVWIDPNVKRHFPRPATIGSRLGLQRVRANLDRMAD